MKRRDSPSRPSARSALDLAECFHLAGVLKALEKSGILNSLEQPVSIRTLAARHSVDGVVLKAALRFLSARTDLLVERAGKFRVTGAADPDARFLLDQYLGAYGRISAGFERVMRDPTAASSLVDRRRHAVAFSRVEPMGPNFVADFALQLGFDHLLDIGCGAGALLVNLATRNTAFSGWGLDQNPWMCTAARKRLSAAGLRRRVRIFAGDARRLESSVPGHVRKRVSVVCAASLANEFFAQDGKQAVEWLRELKKLFPGRTLLVADYYGAVRRGGPIGPPEIMLHNFVQTASGQGVPPGSLAGWRKIYKAARCKLVYVLEIDGTPYFIHLLRL